MGSDDDASIASFATYLYERTIPCGTKRGDTYLPTTYLQGIKFLGSSPSPTSPSRMMDQWTLAEEWEGSNEEKKKKNKGDWRKDKFTAMNE